jgi:hypothetical protein
MPTTKKNLVTAAELKELNEKIAALDSKVTNICKRLGGLRYHVITESANGNDLGPTDFVRLVDNIMDEV